MSYPNHNPYPYAQPLYPQPPSYQQTPQPNFHSASQVHQSAYHMDPFRQWYKQQLATLTFNSRPIIQGLSIAAMERRDKNDWNGMTAVGEELEQAIARAPSTGKLPLLYLLDSISKNVGPPYTTHVFPRFIAATFLLAYSTVDGNTKTDMEKMLRTWRQGGVGGVELFGQEVRENIEAGIFGRSVSNGMGLQGGYPTPIQYGGYPQQVQERVNTPPIAQSGFMGHQVNVEKQNVLKSLSRALHSKRTALSRNPGDAEAKVHVGVLEQIERLLATSNVNPQEIRDIQAQLDMIHNESSNQSGPLSGQSTPIPQQFQTRPVDPYGDAPVVQTSRSQQQHLAPPRHPYSNGGGTPIPFEPGHSRSGSTPVIPHATVPAPAPATGKMDFGNLLRDLAFAGVIGSNSPTPGSTTPILGRARIREGSVTSNESAAFGNGTGDENKADEEDGLQEYEQLILSMNVSLTLTDLNKTWDFQPTTHLPNRCSQCAARFPAGTTGKDRLQAHLDWHFRRNRKERESEGRGANRRWLPRAEFWVRDVASTSIAADGASSSALNASRTTSGMAPKVDAAAIAKKREELQSAWIPVPSDPTKAALPCPICKEKFISEFNEDEEEWIWKNAVEADGQIFHATCRADAVASAVANRIIGPDSTVKTLARGASPARSRANTPQPVGASPLANTSPRKNRDITPAVGQSPARPLKSLEETDIKPNMAALQAAERLNTTLASQQEESIDSPTSSGIKRKAEDQVDAGKEVKKEKAEPASNGSEI